MKSRFVAVATVLLVGSLLSGCATPAVTATPTPTATTCVPAPEFPISAYDLWLQDGHKGTVSDFLASLVGKKGADGYVGYGGPGKAGIAGVSGDDGKSAYQIWLDAGHAGSVDDFVTALTGAAGVDGNDGANGTDGTNGTDGANGTDGTNGADGLNGLSAYELWLELGNTGTKAEFLASLQGQCTVGATGEMGPQGIQGEQGIQGIQGIQGPAGVAGATGPQGPAGVGTPVEVSYTLGGGTTGNGATQPTFNGNPMFYGSYVQLGDVIFFNVRVVMTNITSFGHGQYYVTIPFASKYAFSTSNGRVRDAGATRDYVLYGYAAAGSSTMLLTTQGAGQQTPFDYNTPVTLTTTDVFLISGTYIKQ